MVKVTDKIAKTLAILKKLQPFLQDPYYGFNQCLKGFQGGKKLKKEVQMTSFLRVLPFQSKVATELSLEI